MGAASDSSLLILLVKFQGCCAWELGEERVSDTRLIVLPNSSWT